MLGIDEATPIWEDTGGCWDGGATGSHPNTFRGMRVGLHESKVKVGVRAGIESRKRFIRT